MIEGEYYLEGQREMASGFMFDEDGSFQFFFSYGALDRQGKGTWTNRNGALTLNSGSKPRYDYALVESRKTTGDSILIKMEGGNPVVLANVFCSLEKGIEGSWQQMSQYGETSFPLQTVTTISLLLEFCPERFSTIPVPQEHNEFIFRFEPTIAEVFFENFTIQVTEQGLFGGHPLMEGKEFNYSKQ